MEKFSRLKPLIDGGKSLLRPHQLIIKSLVLVLAFYVVSCGTNKFDFDEKSFSVSSSSKFNFICVECVHTSYDIIRKDGKQGCSVINLCSIPEDYYIIKGYNDTVNCIDFEKNIFYKISNCSTFDAGDYSIYFKLDDSGNVSLYKYNDVKDVRFYK